MPKKNNDASEIPALVKYRNGELPAYRLREVQQMFADGAESLINAKMSALSQVLDKVVSV